MYGLILIIYVILFLFITRNKTINSITNIPIYRHTVNNYNLQARINFSGMRRGRNICLIQYDYNIILMIIISYAKQNI